MKTAILTEKGFEFREIPMPECGENQVLVKTSACGICEGDVFNYRKTTSTPDLKAEIQLGHEGCGTVVQVGSKVKGFKTGDRVAVLGGPYSEYFTCEPEALALVPDKLPIEFALGEPVACFVHASWRFGVKKGDRVAMIGCGFMGLGSMIMARHQGAAEIVVIEPIKWRRDKAIAFGADSVVDPTGKTPQDLLKELGEFDVVMEATGVQAAVDVSTELVKQHGKIILIGYHQSNDGMRTVNMKTWNFKAIDVINGHVRRNDEKLEAMKQSMTLIADDVIKVRDLSTIYKFEDISKAFSDLVNRKEGLFKATLVF